MSGTHLCKLSSPVWDVLAYSFLNTFSRLSRTRRRTDLKAEVSCRYIPHTALCDMLNMLTQVALVFLQPPFWSELLHVIPVHLRVPVDNPRIDTDDSLVSLQVSMHGCR